MAVDLSKLLQLVIDKKASELQLADGLPPTIRLRGDLRPLNLPPLKARDVLGFVKLTAPRPQVDEFVKQGTCEYGYPFRDQGHFLVTRSMLEGRRAIRFRLVPRKRRDAPENGS